MGAAWRTNGELGSMKDQQEMINPARAAQAPSFTLLLVLIGWACFTLAARGDNWVHWRGPWQNGVAEDKDLPDKWSPAKVGENNLIWKASYGCRSTPLVMNGRVYVINDA